MGKYEHNNVGTSLPTCVFHFLFLLRWEKCKFPKEENRDVRNGRWEEMAIKTG